MAFDFGLRQIGVAVGNCTLFTTQPLAVLRAREGQPRWESVAGLIAEWQPDLLVVGDPLNMDDTCSDMAERARRFGRRLHGRFGLPVERVDERLTSFAVKQEQRELGHAGDYRRQPVDSLAAELILQGWMTERQGRIGTSCY
ncbi:MAG: Holliday junction resolvase RuvX [Chromatocurvus sp.]